MNYEFINHSVRNDFTGLAMAAFIAWKPKVSMGIISVIIPAKENFHHYK